MDKKPLDTARGSMYKMSKAERAEREVMHAFRDGQPNRPKTLCSFGDTGIPVKTMRKAGKKRQTPRADKLQMMTAAPIHVEAGKMRGGLQWNNEGGYRQVWRD